MNYLDVHFLGTVREIAGASGKINIGKVAEGTPGTAAEADHGHAIAFRVFGCLQYVFALAAGADREQAVAVPGMSFEVAGEDEFITIVICHATDMANVTDCSGLRFLR